MTGTDTLTMIVKMSAITFVYVTVTFLLWRVMKERESGSISDKIAIGFIYGILSIFSTHVGVNYGDMVLNLRDLAPMAAGLYFSPVSGIIAGLMGGIERYIVGTYFGIGEYTRIACSISTCFAGFFAAFLNVWLFKGKKPSAAYAFFMGAVIEVFHMYVVFLTHRGDMNMAFYVVRICSVPMILFSGIGLMLCTLLMQKSMGELYSPWKGIPRDKVPVSHTFQTWLFGVTVVVLLISFTFNYAMQTTAALQDAKVDLAQDTKDLADSYQWLSTRGGNPSNLSHHIGLTGSFIIIDEKNSVIAGTSGEKYFSVDIGNAMAAHEPGEFFEAQLDRERSLCLIRKLDENARLFARIPMVEVFEDRDIQAYETMLADILFFTVIYVLISMLVQNLVVENLVKVNRSLNRITEGELDEKVDVYNSSEFASLSDDINLTVDVLKGYIDAAEKRIEQELLLAHNIQDSALPKNFRFAHTGFEIFATMDPAKEVGGDFYDFFFVDADKLAMVIADVSGKGIPAALFMMRSKSSIRSLAEAGNPLPEVFARVNNELCAGNEVNMFVTAWIGVIDLTTGVMKCVNAGHEYPSIMRKGGDFELFRDKHRPPLGVMEDLQFTEYELTLDPGDILFVYTDGVPEAINEFEEQYGTERMLSVLSVNSNSTMESLLPAVKEDMDGFVGGADQFDDITMMGFRFNGPQ